MPIERDTFAEVMTGFPTGVAIVTTVDSDGRPWGLTTNAVSSVSVDPPTLLVCINKTSRTLPTLLERKGFLVNFMAAGSEATCSKFASQDSAEEKFSAVSWEVSDAGHPILREEAVGYADCTTMQEIEAASHLILVGEVVDGAPLGEQRDPIAYFRRGYATWPSASALK
jgi:flavin reductase (DIM6/NTAB) family NADH-FMN oxidoreductase RutF